MGRIYFRSLATMFSIELRVLGITNLWYSPTPTPPIKLPINAPNTGTGINNYPAMADPIPIEVLMPIWPIFLILLGISTTLLEKTLCIL